MRLGLVLDNLGAQPDVPFELVQEAERLGFDSVWTGEAYGCDAITPLAFLAAKTDRIRLGTSIMAIAGRSPAMCAMQAQTVDALAGGSRFIAGLGVSGPRVVEGWYGEPWGKPYDRLLDYVQIMLKIFARNGAVQHDGRELSVPYRGAGSSGLGRPLKSILHTNPELPIFIGAAGRSMTRLAAEYAQGLLPLDFVPGSLVNIAEPIQEGFRRAGNGKSWRDFEIVAGTSVEITDDVGRALARHKPGVALNVGGGAAGANVHYDKMVQAGYGDEARRIQDLFVRGRRDEASALVPDRYVDDRVLIGPPARIRERYAAWAESGLTGLNVFTRDPEALALLADAARSLPALGPAAALARTQRQNA